MRPIDADLLLKKFSAECEYSEDCKKTEPCITCIINGCPTLDVEPRERINKIMNGEYKSVVYCKDCEYRKEHHYEDDGEPPYIKYSCKFTKYSMSDMGYCSMGKKKDGEEYETDGRREK